MWSISKHSFTRPWLHIPRGPNNIQIGLSCWSEWMVGSPKQAVRRELRASRRTVWKSKESERKWWPGSAHSELSKGARSKWTRTTDRASLRQPRCNSIIESRDSTIFARYIWGKWIFLGERTILWNTDFLCPKRTTRCVMTKRERFDWYQDSFREAVSCVFFTVRDSRWRQIHERREAGVILVFQIIEKLSRNVLEGKN